MSEKWVLGYEISETGITGRRVGLLVALGRIKASGKVLCACDCGGHTTVYYSNFGRGDHTNCGCQISANRKRSPLQHGNNRGGKRTKEYRAWAHIVGRCTNATDSSFRHYGGRGITIAAEWIADFSAFLAHVGPAPSPRHSVDRIDNDRGYEPGNVRWATAAEQARNKRSTLRVNGRPLIDVCAERGLRPKYAAILAAKEIRAARIERAAADAVHEPEER